MPIYAIAHRMRRIYLGINASWHAWQQWAHIFNCQLISTSSVLSSSVIDLFCIIAIIYCVYSNSHRRPGQTIWQYKTEKWKKGYAPARIRQFLIIWVCLRGTKHQLLHCIAIAFVYGPHAILSQLNICCANKCFFVRRSWLHHMNTQSPLNSQSSDASSFYSAGAISENIQHMYDDGGSPDRDDDNMDWTHISIQLRHIVSDLVVHCARARYINI